MANCVRYISASNVSKLLGKKYNFLWSNKSEIDTIINGQCEKKSDNLNFELNNNTKSLIQHLPPKDLNPGGLSLTLFT